MASTAINETPNKKKKAFNQIQFEDFLSPDSNLFGPFRENMRFFLRTSAELERYTVRGMPVWCTPLVSENRGIIPLYTVEETVQNSIDNPFCNHCKLSGWGHHFVCKRKYHLIIRDNQSWNEQLEENFSEMDTHALYGLIHCNGYGHLVCINGFKSNPEIISATDAMELWDHLCTVLKVRKISVHDVLSKGSVQLRLIHTAACGQSWFGRWGYEFSAGSSGITEQIYKRSICLLNSLLLDKIIVDFKNRRNGKKIKKMIEKYREMSGKPLVTTCDLLLFMMSNESRNYVIHGSNGCQFGSETKKNPMAFDRFVNSMANGDCRWSARRLEHVLVVIVNLLKHHKANSIDGSCGMSRYELREGARKSIGDTGLIDFVLKSIKCFEVDNHIIRRAINPYAGLVEFTIHDETNGDRWQISDCKCPEDKVDSSSMGNQIVYRTKNPITKRIEFAVTENHEILPIIVDFPDMNLPQDLLFFYENVLLEYPEKSSICFATQNVLNSKLFIKEWSVEGEAMSQQISVTCQVLPSFGELETELNRPLSPGAVVVVPPSITIGDLKLVAQSALRDTYCIMDGYVVRQIGGIKAVENEKLLICVLNSDGQVWVRGTGLDLDTHMRYEDGGRRSSSTGKRADGVRAWAIASAVVD